MKILITGITGFIGSHLAKKLVEKGYDVFGSLRMRASKDVGILKDYLENVNLISMDITNYFSVYHTLKSIMPDCIVHLAALTPVRESFEKPYEYYQVNYLGTMNIINSILDFQDYKKRKLIYASTAEVYGIQDKYPIKEDAPLNPTSPYAVSKAAADMYLRMVKKVYDAPITILRPTNTYGRKFEKNFLVEYLITKMLNNEEVYIGAPESIRDYMYVDDHVNAYILAIEKDIFGTFNVSSRETIKNKDLAKKIAKMLNYDENKIKLGRYPLDYPFRPIESDQPIIDLDNNKIKKELNWKPDYNLEKGLKKTIEYWKMFKDLAFF